MVHTSLPGIVDSFDPVAGTVSVKPSIKKLLSDGKTVDLPILKNVPVVFPCSEAGGLTVKLAKNDGVLLIFSERSLEEWKAGNTDSKPASIRKHDLADAFAIPCIFPKSKRTLKKNMKAGNGTMLTGSKVFVGDAMQPLSGSTKPVNVDVVAMLTEVLGILDLLLTPGAIVCAGPGNPATLPTLSTRGPDVKAYSVALSQLILKPS
jgi:hypothetical protein